MIVGGYSILLIDTIHASDEEILLFAIYMQYNEELVLMNELFGYYWFWKDLGKKEFLEQ